MPCCKISDCAQMSKTIIAVRHFGLGGRESLETAVTEDYITNFNKNCNKSTKPSLVIKTLSVKKVYTQAVHILNM